MAEENVSNVGEAILAVMKDVKRIQKEDVDGLPYPVKSERAAISALRPALIKYDLVFFPVKIDGVERDTFEKRGRNYTKTMHRTSALFWYKLLHVPSETSIDIPVLGEGIHEDDKSPYMAITGSKKYALLDAFLIESGDDPDTYIEDEPAGDGHQETDVTRNAKKAELEQAKQKWYALVKDAQGLGLAVDPLPEDISIENLRLRYGELLDRIEGKGE